MYFLFFITFSYFCRNSEDFNQYHCFFHIFLCFVQFLIQFTQDKTIKTFTNIQDTSVNTSIYGSITDCDISLLHDSSRSTTGNSFRVDSDWLATHQERAIRNNWGKLNCKVGTKWRNHEVFFEKDVIFLPLEISSGNSMLCWEQLDAEWHWRDVGKQLKTCSQKYLLLSPECSLSTQRRHTCMSG